MAGDKYTFSIISNSCSHSNEKRRIVRHLFENFNAMMNTSKIENSLHWIDGIGRECELFINLRGGTDTETKMSKLDMTLKWWVKQFRKQWSEHLFLHWTRNKCAHSETLNGAESMVDWINRSFWCTTMAVRLYAK